MDDINFDELDKAVNSALKTDNTSEQTAKADDVATNPVQSVATESTPAPVAAAAAAPATPTAVPQKRRGQFMDIVRSTPTDQGVPVSRRQAPTIAPLSPAVVEATAPDNTPADIVPATEHQEITPDKEGPILNVPDSGVYGAPAPTHDWPDPLEMANTKAALPEVPKVVDTTVEPAETQNANQDDSIPQLNNVQASPFLEGTEVEKRPLGAFADSKEDDTPNISVANQTDTTPNAELEPEIVSVEADEPKEVISVETQLSVEKESDTTVSTVPTTNGSIPQQYHPAVTEADRENIEEHPVFDTKEYHQPLVPATKQHSAGVFKYVLIGLLMLLLGAVGGYLLYVFKLI